MHFIFVLAILLLCSIISTATNAPCLPSQCGVVNTDASGDTTITGTLTLNTQPTTQINALTNNAAQDGGEIYDTTTKQFKGHVNGAWLPFFTGGYQLYADVKAQGTGAGTSTGAAWNNRTLNTAVTGNLDGVYTSLNATSYYVTIQPGTYFIECSAPTYEGGYNLLRLVSITNGVVVATGVSSYTSSSYGVQVISFVKYLGTWTTPQTFNIGHYIGSGISSNGLGVATNVASTPEMYATFQIIKIA